MMKTVPRLLLVLFGVCMMTMMFVTRCGINFDAPSMQQQTGMMRRSLVSVNDAGGQDDPQGALIRQYKAEVEALKQKIANLGQQLQEARQLTKDVAMKPARETRIYRDKVLYYEKFFQQKLNDAEIRHGMPLNNEYELFPFCRFTLTRIYLVDPGLGKRVVEKPIGFKKKDLLEVISYGVEKLNAEKTNRDNEYTQEDFIEGIYRTVPGVGTHYELYFRDLDNQMPTKYRKLSLARPYGPVHLVTSEKFNTRRDTLNLILPLSGRIDKFQIFMDRFTRLCIRHDHRVFLTVVYFGSDGLSDVKRIIGKVSQVEKFKNIKLVTLNEDFNRGRGLQVGAQSWTKGDVLMFLCDVDIVFSIDFLERCRLNAKKGQRVYYPIVFSLYNPKVVYALQDVEIPTENDQLVISKDTGFWRDFGYGMTCQYRSDFLRLKGFDEAIHGWGLEDVYLYKKYVKSNYMVVRATDPGIFHLWHEKYCNPELPADQYRGCIRSKALNEASHSQLGMLAFKDEISAHKKMIKNNR